VSEYQCYDFVAIDRPLTSDEMEELRAISTRAEISSTRFFNEYNWGQLRRDPAVILARYFDAFLYHANWGWNRFMLRLPAKSGLLPELKPYFPGGPSTLTESGEHLIIDLRSDTEEQGEYWHADRLDDLAPLRTDLLERDLSAAYLAWLLAVQSEDEVVAPSAKEPPVPPGLRNPSPALEALIDFLRIDEDLVKAAGEGSPTESTDADLLRSWVSALPASDKDRWLMQAIEDPHAKIRTGLIAAFRRERATKQAGRRSVSQLLSRAEELRIERERKEAEKAEKARRLEEKKRKQYLAALTKEGSAAWSRVEQLLESKKNDDAVNLTMDLHAAALDSGDRRQFEEELKALRERHPRRRKYFQSVRRELESKHREMLS